MGRSAAIAILLAFSGCTCDPADEVPFGQRHQGELVQGETPIPPSTPFEARQGDSFPEGTHEVIVQGSPVRIDEGSVRSLLAIDLDDDTDRDAMLLAHTEGVVKLMHVERDGSAFGVPRVLAELPAPANPQECTVEDPSISTIAAGYGIARSTTRCPDDSTKSVFVFSIEARPRIRELITLLPEDGRTAGIVEIDLNAEDRDEDGHADLVLSVAATPPSEGDAARTRITWLDRPGGLARDTDEPEATLATLAEQATSSLSSDVDAALSTARSALTLHGVLCREGGGPRLRFGQGDGLSCGDSAGAGKAAAAEAIALARSGDLFAAVEALSRLDDAGLDVGAAARRQANQAVSAAAQSGQATDYEAPSTTPALAVSLPPIGFTDDSHVLLRGPNAQLLDLGTTAVGPHAAPPSRAITDPDGMLAVAAVRRTCDGYVLSIVDARNVVSGIVAGRPLSEPLLEPRPAPQGATCPNLPDTLAADDGGWLVVGWAPQGVVAVRGRTIRLVPLGADGAPAGEPRALEAGTPPPAPLPAGAMSRDGNAYAIATHAGIVVRRLVPEDEVVLIAPEGWPDDALPQVAVSPNGRRVAYVHGGRLHVVTLPNSG